MCPACDTAISHLCVYPRDKKTHVCLKIWKWIFRASSPICQSKKLDTTQMPISVWTDKQAVVGSNNELITSNEKEYSTDTHINRMNHNIIRLSQKKSGRKMGHVTWFHLYTILGNASPSTATGNSSAVTGDGMGWISSIHRRTWANLWEWQSRSLCCLCCWFHGYIPEVTTWRTVHLNACRLPDTNYTSVLLKSCSNLWPYGL